MVWYMVQIGSEHLQIQVTPNFQDNRFFLALISLHLSYCPTFEEWCDNFPQAKTNGRKEKRTREEWGSRGKQILPRPRIEFFTFCPSFSFLTETFYNLPSSSSLLVVLIAHKFQLMQKESPVISWIDK